jgi:opacity protein-like surface antigen
MKKKFICLSVLIIGIASIAPAADQIFFDVNGGVAFYPALGGKIGWMHYWDNEKIGLITDISYYNNGFGVEKEGADWREETKKAHNIGIGAGVVFNNMGMSGVIRTMEYVQLRALLGLRDEVSFSPALDLGFKLNVFFTEKTALTAGLGTDLSLLIFPYFYFSLGMTFTL